MVTAFAIMGVLGAGLYFSLRKKDSEILDVALFALTGYIFSYVFFTAGLLIPDFFSVKKAAFLAMLFWCGLDAWLLFRGFRASIKADFKKYLIPLIVSACAVPMVTAVPFEYFGMGQDQGIYQTEAVMYARGWTSKQLDIKEYHIAVTPNEKRQVMQYLKPPYMHVTYTYEDTNIVKVLTGSSVDSINDTAQVMHGLHTFSSLLALWALIFGIPSMTGFNTLVMVLCIFWLYKICMRLKLNRPLAVTAMALFTLSPQVIWCTKSTMTEIGITLIWMVFIYFVLSRNTDDHLWAALLPGMYALYHVSAYVFMPFYVAFFFMLYIYTHEKRELLALILSVASFFTAFAIGLVNSCEYTVYNFRRLFIGPINRGNILYVVTGTCVIVVIAAFVIYRADRGRRAKSTSGFKTLIAGIIIRALALLIPVMLVIKLVLKKYDLAHIAYQTPAAIFIMSGIILPFLMLTALLLKPSVWTSSHEKLVILMLFTYAVVLYSLFMYTNFQYYYYFARYICMYIPIALIAGAVAFTVLFEKLRAPAAKHALTAVCLLLSAAFLLPHTIFITSHKDDSRIEWDTVEEIEKTLRINNAQAVFVQPGSFFYFYYDLKSIGIDVYPLFENFEDEADDVACRYSKVYILDDGKGISKYDGKYRIVLRVNNHMIQDNGLSKSKIFLIPNSVSEDMQTFTLYEYK